LGNPHQLSVLHRFVCLRIFKSAVQAAFHVFPCRVIRQCRGTFLMALFAYALKKKPLRYAGAFNMV
jgi:hypothetical protein